MFESRARQRTRDLEAQLAAIGRSQAMIEFALDGTIITANENFLGTMGYRLNDVAGHHHRLFMPPEERERASYRQFWAELGRGDFKSGLFKRIGNAGREVWLQATYNPILDAAGRPARVIKIATDVTAACMVNAENTGQIRAIQRAQAVIEFGLDGTILTANQNFLHALGYRVEEIAGRHHSIFVEPSECDDPAYKSFWDALRAGEFRAGEFKRLRRDGSAIWLRATYNPIFDLNGKPVKIVKFAADVTPQVQAADQLRAANAELDRLARHMARARGVAEQASRAKTRFLAGMSHELRTPLNGILGYAQLLRRDGGLTSVQSERVQAMLAAGTHLLEMISCVLDLSEIETEGVELQCARVDLVSLAEASLNIVRPAAETKALHLGLTMMPDVPRRVMTDPSRLRQVVLNLLANAVQYTAAGSVELRVCMRQPQGEAARLRFEVADTGPGIPPGQHDLLAAFARLGAVPAGRAEGPGPGLTLARQVAGLLGGTLDYADNPGGGSIFALDIPLLADIEDAAPPARASAFADAEAAMLPSAAVAGRVLVVDDVAMNRDIAAAFVRSAGYEVTCAEGGAEAVAAVRQTPFVAVLMDVRMPEIDGLEAARRIRALDPPHNSVPIVALTAQVFTEQIEDCRAAGMDTHVAKPFTLETLLGGIARGVEAGAARVLMSQATPAAGPGADLPVLSVEALEQTASILKPEAVRAYLDGLAGRMAALQAGLRGLDGTPQAAAGVVEAAHALAGSAGMFGFDRLVVVARHFERSVKADPSQAATLAAGLDGALAQSLATLRARIAQKLAA